MAQMVKRLPTMRETWVQSLGQEDPLEKEIVTQPISDQGWGGGCQNRAEGQGSLEVAATFRAPCPSDKLSVTGTLAVP